MPPNTQANARTECMQGKVNQRLELTIRARENMFPNVLK
uniref:Uncharacterized protein n=1 Tax=Anguilla anguilla TaxID=7936 RepID=A0A0E9Q1V5_ANGAN